MHFVRHYKLNFPKVILENLFLFVLHIVNFFALSCIAPFKTPILYVQVSEVDGIKVVQLGGAINFGNISCFYSNLSNNLDFDVKKHLILMKAQESRKSNVQQREFSLPFRCIVLEMSMVKDIDPAGAEFIEELVENFEKVDVEILVAGIIGKYSPNGVSILFSINVRG